MVNLKLLNVFLLRPQLDLYNFLKYDIFLIFFINNMNVDLTPRGIYIYNFHRVSVDINTNIVRENYMYKYLMVLN